MKIAIVIITYNVPDLIIKQIELISKYCKDNFEIIIVDNSTDDIAIKSIAYHCKERGVRVLKTQASSQRGSDSHAFACNVAYAMLYGGYDYFFFLDHDNFPIRNFSVEAILQGKIMAGLPQAKSKTYFWAGCVMWNDKDIDRSLIDFSVNHELGLDTGGMLYRVVEQYGDSQCVFFDEKYYENPHFRTTMYNFYATINDDMFMHFINSSGWNPIDGNTERINSLINILTETTK